MPTDLRAPPRLDMAPLAATRGEVAIHLAGEPHRRPSKSDVFFNSSWGFNGPVSSFSPPGHHLLSPSPPGLASQRRASDSVLRPPPCCVSLAPVATGASASSTSSTSTGRPAHPPEAPSAASLLASTSGRSTSRASPAPASPPLADKGPHPESSHVEQRLQEAVCSLYVDTSAAGPVALGRRPGGSRRNSNASDKGKGKGRALDREHGISFDGCADQIASGRSAFSTPSSLSSPSSPSSASVSLRSSSQSRYHEFPTIDNDNNGGDYQDKACDEADDASGSDADDTYNSDRARSSCTPDCESFSPEFPLEPLQVAYQPRHRRHSLVQRIQTAIARARSIKTTRRRGERKVSFKEGCDIVHVFSAVDYPGRRGPPPVERLTMRDVLELRQIKIELGVFQHAHDDLSSSSSSSFERINPKPSPTSPAFGSSDIVRESSSSTLDTAEHSTTSSESASTTSSVRSSPASSYDTPSEKGSPDTDNTVFLQMHMSSDSLSPNLPNSIHSTLNGTLRDREASLESVLSSAFTSPSLSLSCSPSPSESDFGTYDEEEAYFGDGAERSNSPPAEANGFHLHLDEQDIDCAASSGTVPHVAWGRSWAKSPTTSGAEAPFPSHPRQYLERQTHIPMRSSRNADIFRVCLPSLSPPPRIDFTFAPQDKEERLRDHADVKMECVNAL